MAFPPKPLSVCALGGRRLETDMDFDIEWLFRMCGQVRAMIVENESLKIQVAELRAELEEVKKSREDGFKESSEAHAELVKSVLAGEIKISS